MIDLQLIRLKSTSSKL